MTPSVGRVAQKKKKIQQARKRAIIWSAQEQLRKALKKQQDSGKTSELKTKAANPNPTEEGNQLHADWSPLTPQLASTSLENQFTTVPTISSIEQTLHILKQQKEQLEVQIWVLSHHLQTLQSLKREEDYE